MGHIFLYSIPLGHILDGDSVSLCDVLLMMFLSLYADVLPPRVAVTKAL